MIKIDQLNKYFNKGKQNEIHVLNNISLELPERGMIAIFGRSGCGKTTLLNVIGGLDSCLSGSVEINGDRVSSNSDALRNRHIGYIFQNYNLNSGATCFDNVADALRLCGMRDKHELDIISSRTMAALSAVGMAPYANRYPDTLSGGQKQRIAIARAIVKSPDIILADEPTGNLDEANTVMIMDILREIAKTRLVLLVTHEAELVDSYCDKVIGITDGSITSVRENDTSAGYSARNKNHIYLGEFEKTSSEAGSVGVDYYGEPIDERLKLTVVNDGGKLYLRVDTPGVHIIDEYGETKLHDGTFARKEAAHADSRLDLSLLSGFEGKRYGSLFTFFSSLKSGSKILTGKKLRRGKRVAKATNVFAATYLICFALIFTLLLSYCASGIALYDSIASDINSNMFYLSLENIDNEALAEAIDNEAACIDHCYTSSYLDMGGKYLRVSTGVFETSQYTNSDSYYTDTQLLPHTLIGDSELLAGSLEALSEHDVVLSKLCADSILKTAIYDYIADYEDLINCTLANTRYGGTDSSTKLRIVAIVDSGEHAAYYSPEALAAVFTRTGSNLALVRASQYGIELERGTAWVGSTTSVGYLPKVGETIKVNGTELSVVKVGSAEHICTDYSDWMAQNGISDKATGSHYEALVSYYSHLSDYAAYRLLTGNDDTWLLSYFVEGNADALFLAVDDFEYYAACKYREANGSFPTSLTSKELDAYEKSYKRLSSDCDDFYIRNDFYDSARYNPTMLYLSDEDYASAILGFGETHPVALSDYYYKQSYSSGTLVMHSTDPAATEAYLRERFPELPISDGETIDYSFVTQSLLAEIELSENRYAIVGSIIALAAGLLLMCVCIYFIMRSSMLPKVREIGIYRAIGVSKSNMIFKYAVEAAAIALQTLTIGFIIGAYIATTLAGNGITSSSFYFPFWLGALTLIILIGTCILFGILPIAALLRKTPAQILAKYDI